MKGNSIPETFQEAVQNVAGEVEDLVILKQHDYGHENILSTGGLLGIAVRQGDKAARLLNLLKTQQNPKNESIRDTLLDQAGYALLGLMLLDDTFKLELGCDNCGGRADDRVREGMKCERCTYGPSIGTEASLRHWPSPL